MLTVTLDNAGNVFGISATGVNQFEVTSSVNGTGASDLFAAGLTGATFNAGIGQLALNSGVSGDTSIKIVDLAGGGSVVFNDSGANGYAVPISVSLTQLLAGGVTFNGASTFAHNLSIATTNGNITSAAGSNITVTGSLTLTAAADITLAGNVTISGNTVLNANGTVSAAGSNTFTGGVFVSGDTASGAAAATLNGAGALTLGDINVIGGLSVTAGGTITGAFGIEVGDAASFTAASGNVTLNGFPNIFEGDISASVQGAGTISINNAIGTTTLGTMTLGTGNLSIFGVSTITEDSHAVPGGIATAANSAATLSFNLSSAGTVDLSQFANNLPATVHLAINGNGSAASFLLQDISALATPTQLAFSSFPVQNLTLNFTQAAINVDNLPAAAASVTGNLTLTANGAITQSSTVLSVGGTASFTSATGAISLGTTTNVFSGDVSAAVSGTNSIQIDNDAATTTLGAITLGTGNLTLNAESAGTATITEDPAAAGIVTGTPATSAQLAVNIASATTANVRLNTAANNIASTYAVKVNGVSTGTSTGDFGYRSTAAGAGLSQITLTHFTIKNLTLEFDTAGANIALSSLPAASGNVAVTLGGNISISAAYNVTGTLALTAGGNISETGAGVLTVSGAATFTATGSGAITLSAANNISGAVSLNTAATGTGNVAFTDTGAIQLASSSLGTGTLAVTAGGGSAITEQVNAHITQGSAAGQASFTAGPTATSINLSGKENVFTGVVSFSGADVTTVVLENANPLATLSAVALTGVPNLTSLTLRYDGTTAALALTTPAAPLSYALDLIEENDIVLPATASFTVGGSNNLTLESLNGSINLFGVVTVPGTLTLKADGFGSATILDVNPASTAGTLSLVGTTFGNDTIVVSGALTLGSVNLTGGGLLSVTSLTGAIQQAAGTSMTVSGPATFFAGGDVTLTATTNIFRGALSATVTGANTVSLTNTNSTTTVGSFSLGTGTLTINDRFSGSGSQIVESTAGSIVTQGAIAIVINTDTTASVNLSNALNLILGSVSITGATGGTTGALAFRNASPLASTGELALTQFTPTNLTLIFDLASIVYDGTLAPSSTGNLTLVAGAGITQVLTPAAAIVTSGSIGGFVGDASIDLGNTGNKIATGANSTISFSAQFADNKQVVALVNQGNIDLSTSSLGLGAFSLTSTNGNILELKWRGDHSAARRWCSHVDGRRHHHRTDAGPVRQQHHLRPGHVRRHRRQRADDHWVPEQQPARNVADAQRHRPDADLGDLRADRRTRRPGDAEHGHAQRHGGGQHRAAAREDPDRHGAGELQRRHVRYSGHERRQQHRGAFAQQQRPKRRGGNDCRPGRARQRGRWQWAADDQRCRHHRDRSRQTAAGRHGA